MGERFIHFEDWSIFTNILNKKNIKHGGRIIKAFASSEDPRITFSNPNLAVVKESDDDFRENYSYPEQVKEFDGDDLEAELDRRGFDSIAKKQIRTLFRFANNPNTPFCITGMAIKHNAEWLIKHPFDDIDGLEEVIKNPALASRIHLDIFTTESLNKLRDIVDYDDETQLVSMTQGSRDRSLK